MALSDLPEKFTGPVNYGKIAAVIAGERVTTANWVPTHNPSDGSLLAEVAQCGPDEVRLAVAGARSTFNHTWREVLAPERGRLLRALADRIRVEADQLAWQESLDTGKPLTQAAADVAGAARYYEYYGCVVEAMHGDVIGSVAQTHAYTRREPHGVTAHIVPWNYPLQITARTTAPAIAAGNCCVVKPAEDAPLGAVRLAELALECGFPAGVFNVVTGTGATTGAALAARPDIDHLSFTGSVPVGREIAAVAGRNLVPVALELGGKSPNIVFPDADLDRALPVIVGSITQNCGQTCSAGSRLLLHESIQERVVAEIGSRFANLRLGAGVSDPDLGPLISAKQRDRVRDIVQTASTTGRIVVGGDIPTGPNLSSGFFFEPTLVDQVPSDSVLAQEEAFGPVLAVTTFADDDEAVAIANGTRFGLVAAVWTSDVDRAHAMATRIEAGQVFVNSYGAGGGVELPFGGIKESGYGREKGFEALINYTRTKTVAVRAITSERGEAR